MITIECDRCEKSLQVADALAGSKYECPHCGDMNLVPDKPQTRPKDKAEALGLPPDSGQEQRVMLVRPAMFRARPMRYCAMVLGFLAGLFSLGYGMTNDKPVLTWLGIAVAVICMGIFIIWKISTLSAALEITNKRTIERRGLLSKATSEVVHDNIRNIQIHQSFWERIFGVGQIGISSSGQDGIEISMKNLAKPDRIRETIDAYRPL